jgi:hypothetical protein
VNRQNPIIGRHRYRSAIRFSIGTIFKTGSKQTKNHTIEKNRILEEKNNLKAMTITATRRRKDTMNEISKREVE